MSNKNRRAREIDKAVQYFCTGKQYLHINEIPDILHSN